MGIFHEDLRECLWFHSVRVSVGHIEAHEIHYVDESYLHLRSTLAHVGHGGQSLHGHHVTAAGDDHVRLGSLLHVASPLPHTQACLTVSASLWQRKVLELNLLILHDD